MKADEIMDWVPFFSMINNALLLITKLAIEIISCIFPLKEIIQSLDTPNQLIYRKNASGCVLLAIPFLNLCVAALRHLPRRTTRMEQPQQRVQQQQQPNALQQLQQPVQQQNPLQQQVDQMQAETQARLKQSQMETRQKQLNRITELDKQIANCDDSEQGKLLRSKLLIAKEYTEKQYRAYLGASSALTHQSGLPSSGSGRG